ncbi:MAG: VWA domain-containing protein [Desulfobulbus sp.]|nr:MAG: VWA domain-containing protein [Desulfobulbus sp.]
MSARQKRRGISSFNLAFLDIMFCGFGAVVLLVLIINSNALKHRKEVFDDLRGEVDRLETQVRDGQKQLVEVKNTIQEVDNKLVISQGKASELLVSVQETSQELSDARNLTRAKKKHVRQLQADLKSLENTTKRIGAKAAANARRGRKNIRVTGNGQRQYLTGLRLGGKRILILLDRSASMLDSTIVNVIRRRNMSDNDKKSAPKWRKARRTVAWLVANLPASSSLQVYGFNTKAEPVLASSAGKWIPVSKSSEINQMINSVHKLIPQKGTSLENAFRAAAAMQPRPDNILLITDGLPTQGRSKPMFSSVSGKARIRLFERAVKALPGTSTVNTLLLPMEGDPVAPALFWKLAVDTGGSFLTPTADWP